MTVTITASEFKVFFDRGQFTYGTDLPAIRDKDIDEAIAEAEALFPSDLFPDEIKAKQALFYFTAHFLTIDVEMGDSGGATSFNISSHSADGLSESFSIPQWMTEGDFALYSTTGYGQKYLMLIKQYLDGVVLVVGGSTRP